MGCLWISYFGHWPLQASAAYHPPSGQVWCWLHFLAGLAVGRIVKHPKKTMMLAPWDLDRVRVPSLCHPLAFSSQTHRRNKPILTLSVCNPNPWDLVEITFNCSNTVLLFL